MNNKLQAQVTKQENQATRFARYVSSGEIAVHFGQYLLMLAGTVSEPVLQASTLWITACATAPELVAHAEPVASVLTSLAFVSFALLPEITSYKAIVKCLRLWQHTASTHTNTAGKLIQYENWKAAWLNSTRLSCAAWALLYTLPTCIFVYMTVTTLLSFTMSHGHVSVLNGNTLGVRCLAGWFYVLVSLVEKEIGRGASLQTGVLYTQEVPGTRPLEYTTHCQVKARKPQISVVPLSQPAQTPIVTQAITSHSEVHTSTLETPDEVHTDTFVAQVNEEEVSSVAGNVRTSRKQETKDSSKTSLNKSQWIQAAYLAHPSASISEIQELALLEGFSVSRGLVSAHRP